MPDMNKPVAGCTLGLTFGDKVWKCGVTCICTSCGWEQAEDAKRHERIQRGEMIYNSPRCKTLIVPPIKRDLSKTISSEAGEPE